MKQKFNPPKFKCKICGATIQSKKAGHFSQCFCEEDWIAVDYMTSTRGRLIGNLEHFEEIKDE